MEALIQSILCCFENYSEDIKTLDTAFEQVIVTYSEQAVDSYQYVLVGTCFLWTLENCLGSARWLEVQSCWTKIYSHFLKVGLPKSVELDKAKSASKPAAPSGPPPSGPAKPPRNPGKSKSGSTPSADTASKRNHFVAQSQSRIILATPDSDEVVTMEVEGDVHNTEEENREELDALTKSTDR